MLKNIVTSRSVKTSLPRPRPNQNKQLKLLYPVKDKMANMCQREQTHMFLLSNLVFKKSKGMKYQTFSDKYKYKGEVPDNYETQENTNTAFPICKKSFMS